MTLINHVQLTITTETVGVARAGFGIPMILSANATFSERIRFYNALSGVLDDFAADSPEALAATAFFSQQPHPTSIAIGRAENKPTQKYVFTPIAIDDHVYEITAVNEGGTTETVSFTADATATIAEITAGLLPLLNAVVGKNFTAVDNTTDLEITGDAAGDWFSLELGDPTADGKIEQTHVDPGVAADLTAIQDVDDSWYALHTLYNSNAYVLAAAAVIEAQTKIYVFTVNETDAIKVAVGGASDTLDDIKTLNYGRIAGIYHPSNAAFNDAAWMGRCLPTEPGSITWKFKTLTGIAAVPLTATHRLNLVNKKANFNQDVAGQNIMAEGTTADGDFIDVQRGIDWLNDDMSKAIFIVLSAAEKVPYTDPGVAVVQAEVLASLQRAVDRTILAADPAPVVTVPAVADVATVDKAARTLPDVKFTGTLAGAIHKAIIDGVISV